MSIYYCENAVQLKTELFTLLLSRLPFCWREKIGKYRRWQDRQASLFGKLLLIEGLNKIGIYLDKDIEFQFSKNDRPSLLGTHIDFNISHTDGIVVCAISKENKVGIDIEYVKDVGLQYYTETMTRTQWNEINSSTDRLQTFFKYWTMKESVLKVDGRGITLPLDIMEVTNNSIELDSGKWYINPLEIKKGYIAHFATKIRDISYEIIPVKFFKSY